MLLPVSVTSHRVMYGRGRTFAYIILLTHVYTSLSTDTKTNVVKPSCDENASKCEFKFVIEEKYTMMWYGPSRGQILPVFARPDGLVARQRRCDQFQHLADNDTDHIVFADGTQKLSLLVNGQLPGPPIVVYEHQQVVVNVTNAMSGESTTIHWHGITQRNSPWMDGVSGLSQCAINPGETFTYRFLAEPVGTHWYHSHHSAQVSMGVYGPLIILPRTGEANKHRRSDPLPVFDAEFYMMVQDFMREASIEMLHKNQHEAVSFAYGFKPNIDCFNSTKQSDGLDAGVYPFNAAIINGRGRRYKNGTVENSNVPLEVFEVKKGGKYRFRVVCATMLFAFRVSVDGHVLNIISSDGSDVTTKQVESFIMFSGERYDFWIDAVDPMQSSGNYWIRVETLEKTQNDVPITPGHGEAVLSYSPTNREDPVSTRLPCTADKPCLTLNCPYRAYPDAEHRVCLPLTDLRSTKNRPTLPSNATNVAFREYFFNYHFSFRSVWRPTINGLSHKNHHTPLQIHPDLSSVQSCDLAGCDVSGICECPHIVHVPLHTVIQMVIVTSLNNPAGVRNGNVHPVHLHGHQFQVLKIGFSTLDPHTKIYESSNSDYCCVSRDSSCDDVTWCDRTWLDGNVPDIIESGAPYKDTIAVPAGGYAVVRIYTDNPGFWYMHCHVEFHNEEGMAMVLQAGDVNQMNAAPNQIHSCGDVMVPEAEFLERVQNPVNAATALFRQTGEDRPENENIYFPVAIAFIALSGLLLTVNIALCLRLKRYTGYTALIGTENT